MPRTTFRLTALFLIAGLLTAAGCAHYDVTSDIATSIPTNPPTASTNLPIATGDGVSWGGEFVPPREGQGDHDIRVWNFECAPNVLIVNTGTTVTWQNLDFKPFDVISEEPGLFAGEILALGGTWSYTFDKAGTFGYTISPYDASCRGIVVVQN